MNRFIATFVAIGAILVVTGGCKKEETVVATPPSTDTLSPAGTASPATMDFSSDERINATVVPAVKALLSADTVLAGKTLDVYYKDKVVHIHGDLANNEQKRRIDAIIAPVVEKAKASGVNFMNGAIVKG